MATDPNATTKAAAPATAKGVAPASSPAAASSAPAAAAAAAKRQPNANQVFRQPPQVLRVPRAAGGGRAIAKPAPPPAPVKLELPPLGPSDKRAVELHKGVKLTENWKFRAAAARFRWPVGKELTEAEYDKAISDTINARFGGM